MKTRPILFNGEMVQAILAGHKTQTRRVIKPQPKPNYGTPYRIYKNGTMASWCENSLLGTFHVKVPFIVGEKLWVRETFAIETNFNLDSNEAYPPPFNDGRPVNRITDEHYGDHWEQCHYRATDPTPELVYGDGPTVRWKPSIHMPRWASRITLEITEVRVERLQEISRSDIVAEGVATTLQPHTAIHYATIRQRFANLWNSINLKRGYPWSDEDLPDGMKTGHGRVLYGNPWVWVVEFKVIKEGGL